LLSDFDVDGLHDAVDAGDDTQAGGLRPRTLPCARELRDARRAHRELLLVGVNSRDLVTLKVVPGRLDALAASLPTEFPRVAESGVATAEDAARVAAAGYDVALVGSALMSAEDPARLARAMLSEGRAAVSARAALVGARA
jgi:hypothetical protein